MKTLPLEQLDQRLTQALESQPEREAIGLTQNEKTVAFLLRLPEAMKDAEADVKFSGEDPSGRMVVVVEAKYASYSSAEQGDHQPVFGAGRGTLAIMSDDNEHLSDFKEYME